MLEYKLDSQSDVKFSQEQFDRETKAAKFDTTVFENKL